MSTAVEQSVGCGQVTGGIEKTEGDHGENVALMDAGVRHCYQSFGLDLAGADKLKTTPPADDPSFNRLVIALSQSQTIVRA